MRRRVRANVNPGGRHVNSRESRDYSDKGGWKIHLTVRPQNYEMVDMWLDKNHPGQYKLLHGGDPGEKDFTIYVGHKDDAIRLSRKMLTEIGHLLERNNAGGEDIKIHEKIAMRFDPRGDNNRFVGRPGFDGSVGVYYGRNGIPYDRLATDIREQINIELLKRDKGGKLGVHSPEELKKWEKLLLEHEELLKKDLAKRYGHVFSGTGNELLRKKNKRCKCKVKK